MLPDQSSFLGFLPGQLHSCLEDFEREPPGASQWPLMHGCIQPTCKVTLEGTQMATERTPQETQEQKCSYVSQGVHKGTILGMKIKILQ